MSDLITAEHLGITILTNKYAVTYNWASSSNKNKQWMARITGICTKFGFKREFVNSKSRSSDDVKNLLENKYIYEAGWIYQYAGFMVDHLSNKLVDGYFVAYHNGIISIEKEQVRSFLGMPIKEHIAVKSFTLTPDSFVDDDIPF